MIEDLELSLSASDIAGHSKSDPIISQVLEWVRWGWPRDEVSEQFLPYFHRWWNAFHSYIMYINPVIQSLSVFTHHPSELASQVVTDILYSDDVIIHLSDLSLGWEEKGIEPFSLFSPFTFLKSVQIYHFFLQENLVINSQKTKVLVCAENYDKIYIW